MRSAGVQSAGQTVHANTAPSGFHPADLRAAYGVTKSGQGVIAIVDAYHYPTALADFNTFSSTFGLPTESSSSVTSNGNQVFQIVYASGSQPSADSGWSQESALDIEWAHAMAPSAKILLVEAASSNYGDMMNAVYVAAHYAGVTQISLSWGGNEFGGETSYDSYFSTNTTNPSISYFASSGDTGGVVEFPAASSAVIGVGGTALHVDGSGVRTSETGWSGSGGGKSAVVSMPSFQSAISGLLNGRRGTPDVSAVADPSTGVAVYNLYANGGWAVFGGTSAAAPIVAAIVNSENAGRGTAQRQWIYSNTSYFYDVTSGTAGGNTCTTGYDFVTGFGAPLTLNTVPTVTPIATNTSIPTVVPTLTPTRTATPIPTSTPLPTATATVVPTIIATATAIPTATPTPTQTATKTSVPVATATQIPTRTATPVPVKTCKPNDYSCLQCSTKDLTAVFTSAETYSLRLNLLIQAAGQAITGGGNYPAVATLMARSQRDSVLMHRVWALGEIQRSCLNKKQCTATDNSAKVSTLRDTASDLLTVAQTVTASKARYQLTSASAKQVNALAAAYHNAIISTLQQIPATQSVCH